MTSLTTGATLTRPDELRGERLMLFLETPRTGAGIDAATAAVRRGVSPVILMEDPDSIDRFIIDEYLRLGAVIAQCDTSSTSAVVSFCRELAGRNELTAFTCVYEYYVERSAKTARELGLPGPDPDAVSTCRSKQRQRAALSPAGLNPVHAVASDPDAAVARAAEIGLPVVLKPICLSGSAYVKRCDDLTAVRDMASKILSIGWYNGVTVAPVVMIEEFVDGPEFSVEMFDGTAVGVTAKETAGSPFFVELAHTYPAPCPPELSQRVNETAEIALAKVGLDSGPAHVEVKVDSETGRVIVIEVNPRQGGDRIPELVRLAEGIDISAMHVDTLLGLPVDLRATRQDVAVIRFVPTPAKGRLIHLGGMEEAARVDGVVEVMMEPEVSGNYFANGSNRDRLVHVITVANTADQAHRVAREAIGRLTIQWADIAGDSQYP